jgi:hypothetical protein
MARRRFPAPAGRRVPACLIGLNRKLAALGNTLLHEVDPATAGSPFQSRHTPMFSGRQPSPN